MTSTRARIRQHIESNPGVHFRELTRTLDLATGQVQYHLKRLEDVSAESVNGRVHYYPADYSRWERQALAYLRRETARDILVSLLERETARPDDVTGDLEIARSTLEHHLEGLVESDIVEKRRDGSRVVLSLSRPEATASLLGTVDPTLAERLTDRFERLLDNLFEEGR